MERDAAVAEATFSVEPTLDGLIEASTEARRAEGQMAASLQEAGVYLGERQRAWQTAQERTMAALRALAEYIDRRAGVDSDTAGPAW
jgi:hypothetical protein